MGYVTIQVSFSSRNAMVGGNLRGWQVGGSLQSTGSRRQNGPSRSHWQAAAAAARAQTQAEAGTGSQALRLLHTCFDEGVAFPDKT